jgi:hypothetical protein
MTVDTLIILAGAFVAILPSLGFPVSWDNVFYVILGFFIVALGIAVRRRRPADRPEVKHTHFAESLPGQGVPTALHHEESAQ